MAGLFGTTRNNITMHLTNVLFQKLSESSVCKDFLHTPSDEKKYKTKNYNLYDIFAVKYKKDDINNSSDKQIRNVDYELSIKYS